MRLPVTGGVRVNAYEVLRRAVEQGVGEGWRNAHKHTDAPDAVKIQEAVEEAVVSAICEVFEFEPGGAE